MPTPLWGSLVLGVIGGAAMLFAFPPYDLWMLFPVSLAALNAAVLTRRWPAALAGSLAAGLAFFVPLTMWANTYAGTMPWIALGIFEALYFVLYGLLARIVLVRRGVCLSGAVIVSGLWVGVETLRSHAPWGGLPWGATAFSLHNSPLLNLGPWIGMAGLAFVTSMLGMFLLGGLMAVLGRRRRGMTGLGGVWPLAMVAAMVLGCLVVPFPRNPAPESGDTLKVAGIQGNMGEIDPATLTMPPDVFENHLEATDEAVSQIEEGGSAAQLIVWPEDSADDPRTDPLTAEQLESASQSAQAPILVGMQAPTEDGMRYNHAIEWTAEGQGDFLYAKRHPVPFGEYMPARDFFGLFTDKVDLVGTDMKAGEEVGVMDVDGHGLGVLICFEIAYDNLVQDVVDDDAQAIVVQSNNALFGQTDEAIQQLAQAKVFSVISGRSVVHVSTVGHSAIFTPEGRRLDSQDHWTQGSVMADVPLRTGITPAMAAGPWIAVGLTALGVAGLLMALGSKHRAVDCSTGRGREGKRRR